MLRPASAANGMRDAELELDLVDGRIRWCPVEGLAGPRPAGMPARSPVA
ncbi:hypothetical protein [Streptomyces sp. NBC_00019]